MINIPKIIHQTWKTSTLPEKWQPSQDSIKKHMPDWSYHLWTDEENSAFVREHFPDFVDTFEGFPYGIQRADAIRYMLLYVYGGLYMDCDFEVLGDLSSLFVDKANIYLIHSSNKPNLITNGFMASVPGCDLWLRMLETMKQDPGFYRMERHMHVMYTTGPMALDYTVRKYGIPYKQLDSSKINPYHMCDRVFNKPDALLRPLEGSSWVSPIGKAFTTCYCESNFYQPAIGIIVILVLVIVVLALMSK